MTRTNILGLAAVVLLFLSMFAGLFGAHAGTAPERQCGGCGRWGHWWGTRCPHCGAQG